MKKRIIITAVFFLSGLAYFGAFLFTFTRLFDERMPTWYEALPLASLALLTLYVFLSETD